MQTINSAEYYSLPAATRPEGEIAHCAHCGHETDVIISDVTDDEIGECPQCGSPDRDDQWIIRRA